MQIIPKMGIYGRTHVQLMICIILHEKEQKIKLF